MYKQILVFLLLTAIMVTSADIEEPFCQTDNAYATADEDGIEFDLLCKPSYAETIELDSDDSVQVTINLENYKSFADDERVDFRLHFAIERGSLEIRQPGSFGAEDLSDFGGNLKDLAFRTDEDSVEVEITNEGFRSAIFDLSVRPD